MATIEKRYLPLNPSTTITEADRSKVYDMIRKKLADLLTGNQSYYPDGVPKDSNARASDLDDFIASITGLQNHVNDPSNILGKAVDDLSGHASAFRTIIEGNEPVDHIEIPGERSPTTQDKNEMYIPDLGPYSPPNPLLRDQWKKELEASADPPDEAKSPLGGTRPDIYSRLRTRTVSALPGASLPNRTQPPPLQTGRALGISTGKPMPSWITPPPLGGLGNNSNAAGNNDGFNLLAGLVSRNPTQPEPPQQTADSIPERRLGRSTYGVSPASVFDTGAAAVPFVSSRDANYSGGLLGMFAALAGSDPNQPVSPGDEQEQADLQTLEDRLSSSGNINDAWALYKARIAGRR